MRVMLVDDNKPRRADIEELLRNSGHEVISLDVSNPALQAVVDRHQPDVILIDVDAPSRDTLESLGKVSRARPRPMVLFSGQAQLPTIRRAMNAGVTSYVVDGLELHRIQPILDVAIARFEQHQELKNELALAKTQLCDDREISKAKGLMMSRRNFTETEATLRLQALADQRGISLGDAARLLLGAAELL